MIGKGAFIASKAFAKKHYTSAIQSIKELKGPATKYATATGKHIMKHKGKYTAGTVAAGGVGLYSASKNNNLGKLKKSDPRYKIMKQKGYL
ncbi:MAG: hypothetical protein HN490_01705 [Gammaproteobacteria bacterium]|jgi:hypothetical protein|nr:hypothetical protein [Gammaproteobacteria bacterium]